MAERRREIVRVMLIVVRGADHGHAVPQPGCRGRFVDVSEEYLEVSPKEKPTAPAVSSSTRIG